MRILCQNCNVLCILKEETTHIKLNSGDELEVYEDCCWSCGAKFPKIEKTPSTKEFEDREKQLEKAFESVQQEGYDEGCDDAEEGRERKFP